MSETTKEEVGEIVTRLDEALDIIGILKERSDLATSPDLAARVDAVLERGKPTLEDAPAETSAE